MTKGEGRDARGAALFLRFLGASPKTKLQAEDLLPGKVNYLIGNGPSEWHTGVPSYSTVVYQDLWPGIDMTIRGKAGKLKYQFLVRPGARASDIGLAYDGANGISLSRGSLLVTTPLGVLRDSPPVTWQRVGGKKVAVESRYVIGDGASGEYGFAVGSYDARYPLVIDPGLDYSTYLGGHGRDNAFGGVEVDGNGNACVAGSTSSPTFPPRPGPSSRSTPARLRSRAHRS